jgi:hypothetical protein
MSAEQQPFEIVAPFLLSELVLREIVVRETVNAPLLLRAYPDPRELASARVPCSGVGCDLKTRERDCLVLWRTGDGSIGAPALTHP